MALHDDLVQLLLPISPRTRQQLEVKCLSVHPLSLLSILQAEPSNQLAGVLLGRRIQECWSTLAAADRQQLQSHLLQTLDRQVCEDAVVRTWADCAACIARSLATDGITWLELLMWIRKAASEREQTPQQFRGAMFVLGRLSTVPEWQNILEPHLVELCEGCMSVLKGRIGAEEGARVSQASCQLALECLGSLAAIARGDEAARLFHHQVVGLLVSDAIMGSELCEAALQALSQAAAADELLIADPSFYSTPGLPPEELCRVVQLALTASVTQRGQRRALALRLLHSIADAHSRLLCTSRSGQLTAEEVILSLVGLVAADEVRLKANWEGIFVGQSSAAQSGAEYALLARISKRLPDKLVLPVIYRGACRALAGSDVAAQVAALASLGAVLSGCSAGVKKQLHRFSKVVLRALSQPALHPVAFALASDLCLGVGWGCCWGSSLPAVLIM